MILIYFMKLRWQIFFSVFLSLLNVSLHLSDNVTWLRNGFNVQCILGEPGADNGDEEKSKRAEKYMAQRKVKNGEKSPWGQCPTKPVPNGRRRSGFWLAPEKHKFSIPPQNQSSLAFDKVRELE